MKNKTLLLVGLLIVLMVTGVSLSLTSKNKPKIEKRIEASVKNVFKKVEPRITSDLAGKKVRLGEINLYEVNAQGEAKRWNYVYYGQPNEKDVTEVYDFWWKKGEIITEHKTINTHGFIAEYRQELGNNWLDSDQIVHKVQDLFENNQDSQITMELRWDVSVSKTSPIWFIRKREEKIGQEILINAYSGERIK